MVQTQLINSRFAFANSLQNSQQQQQRQNIAVLQPAYSNNSSASNNLISMSAFTSNFDIVAETAPSPHSLEPLQLSRPSQDEEEDEEESHIPHVFGNEILHRSWLPQLSFCLLELLALTHTYSCAITCFYDNAMLANWCILELSTVSLGKAKKKKKITHCITYIMYASILVLEIFTSMIIMKILLLYLVIAHFLHTLWDRVFKTWLQLKLWDGKQDFIILIGIEFLKHDFSPHDNVYILYRNCAIISVW